MNFHISKIMFLKLSHYILLVGTSHSGFYCGANGGTNDSITGISSNYFIYNKIIYYNKCKPLKPVQVLF